MLVPLGLLASSLLWRGAAQLGSVEGTWRLTTPSAALGEDRRARPSISVLQLFVCGDSLRGSIRSEGRVHGQPVHGVLRGADLTLEVPATAAVPEATAPLTDPEVSIYRLRLTGDSLSGTVSTRRMRAASEVKARQLSAHAVRLPPDEATDVAPPPTPDVLAMLCSRLRGTRSQ